MPTHLIALSVVIGIGAAFLVEKLHSMSVEMAFGGALLLSSLAGSLVSPVGSEVATSSSTFLGQALGSFVYLAAGGIIGALTGLLLTRLQPRANATA